MSGRQCSVDGCDLPHVARGYCSNHYSMFADKDPCAIEGCDRPSNSQKGYCLKHYKRWKRHGDASVTRTTRQEIGCKVDGCQSPHAARGWCKQHYYRWYYTGDPLTPIAPSNGKIPEPCKVPGCGGKRNGGGYCNKHGKRVKAWGDPDYLGYGQVTSQTPTYVYLITNESLGATKVGIGVDSRLRTWQKRGWQVRLKHLTDRETAQRIERAVLDEWATFNLPTPFTRQHVGDGFTEVVASTVVAPAIGFQLITALTREEPTCPR